MANTVYLVLYVSMKLRMYFKYYISLITSRGGTLLFKKKFVGKLLQFMFKS